MVVPGRDQALRLLESLALPDGIVVHSTGVARVAAEAARLVAAAGVPVDVRLVEVAALLHDIDKPQTRDGGGRHGAVAAERLIELGYPELAAPVASHPVTCLLDDRCFPRGWPSVLVSIADRHVAQTFLTIDERIDDMQRRHPEYIDDLETARRPAHALEAELCEAVGMDADLVVARLRAAWEAGA
jgi:putative nucleotidyltransferase with HDIG domain